MSKEVRTLMPAADNAKIMLRFSNCQVILTFTTSFMTEPETTRAPYRTLLTNRSEFDIHNLVDPVVPVNRAIIVEESARAPAIQQIATNVPTSPLPIPVCVSNHCSSKPNAKSVVEVGML